MRLNLHALFRPHEDSVAVDMGLEGDALLFDLPESGQGKYLKTAGIRKNRSVPVCEAVKSAQLMDERISRPHVQVIGIAQHHLRADPPQVVGGDGSLDDCHGSDIHKNRCLDGSVDSLHSGPFCPAVPAKDFILHIILPVLQPLSPQRQLPALPPRSQRQLPVLPLQSLLQLPAQLPPLPRPHSAHPRDLL